MTQPYIMLKWGTLKGWGYLNEDQVAVLNKYLKLGASISVMEQVDTAEHKKALCDAIDLFKDGQIINDWSGEKYTREQAKQYIMEYNKHPRTNV